MAAIITLLLFFWIVTMFAKGLDKMQNASWERTSKQIKKRDAFFANIYTIAWTYYQMEEENAIRACCEWKAKDKRIGHDFISPGIQLEHMTEKLYGEGISHAAIKKAMQDLFNEDVEWFIKNPNPVDGDRLGREYIQVPKIRAVITDQEVEDIMNYNKYGHGLPKLGSFYSFSTAMNATCARSISCIPEKLDERVYRYTMGTLDQNGDISYKKWTRAGTPKDYQYNILQKEKLQSTPKLKYQFNDTSDGNSETKED